MNILTDKLPHSVAIGKTEVPVNWDFRTSIKFTLIIEDSDKSKEDKLLEGLRLYYPRYERLTDIGEAVNKMLWFYNCGKEDDEDDIRSARHGGNNNVSPEKAFSYDVDSDLIYAAFYEQYGIDLQTASLHWWQFRALFLCISEKTHVGKIMGYRTVDLSGLDKEQAAYYRKMRRMYRLPGNISAVEKKQLAALNEALKNGGDISALIGGDDEKG